MKVRITTGLGDITVALAVAAPRSAAVFLAEVDASAYDGGAFARIIRRDNDRGSPIVEVVQAGCAPTIVRHFDIPIETTAMTGLRHEDGTISLGVDGLGMASARVFFIGLGRQPGLDAGGGRSPDNLGCPVFGRVIAGMDIVRAIHAIPTMATAPIDYWRGQIAVDPVPILRIARLDI